MTKIYSLRENSKEVESTYVDFRSQVESAALEVGSSLLF